MDFAAIMTNIPHLCEQFKGKCQRYSFDEIEKFYKMQTKYLQMQLLYRHGFGGEGSARRGMHL